MTDDDFTDGPADERCETCSRLDPANCPCPPSFPPYSMTISAATEETPMVLAEIADERIRQTEKWGVQSWPNGTTTDYVGAAQAAKYNTDAKAALGTVTWADILAEEFFEALAEVDPAALRAELVQVAAVATSWVEDIDRKADAAHVASRVDAEVRRRALVEQLAREEALRAFRESEMIGQAIADGSLPLAQPGEVSR